jgi:hypothetical protein
MSSLRDGRDRRAGGRGDAAMRQAAATLAPVALPDWGLAGPPCRFLTGTRFAHQTVFCARSFEWACETHVRLEIFDDGTLEPDQIAMIHRALPHARIADRAATEARLDRVLPTSQFPVLRGMRSAHPLMRKILDLHTGFDGWSLQLDSDMLFFGSPQILRDWLRQPAGEFFMQQHGDALVDRREQLSRDFGIALVPGVNTGIVAIDDRGLDWPLLESAASRLSETGRAHRWAEQTLMAYELSRRGATPLPQDVYVLCNSAHDLAADPPVLRHYVNKSKWLYTAHEWRLWVEHSRAGRPQP